MSEKFLLLFTRKLNSWIIRVNFADFYFFVITVLTFPRYFLRKLNMVLQSLLMDTGRRPVSSSQKLESVAARARNYTRSTPVLPSSPRSITVTRFEKVYFNWFNVRYPTRGREANGKPRRFRGRIKTFRSHLSPPDVYSSLNWIAIRYWIFLENHGRERYYTYASIIEPIISIKEMER